MIYTASEWHGRANQKRGIRKASLAGKKIVRFSHRLRQHSQTRTQCLDAWEWSVQAATHLAGAHRATPGNASGGAGAEGSSADALAELAAAEDAGSQGPPLRHEAGGLGSLYV